MADRNYLKPKLTKYGELRNVTFSREFKVEGGDVDGINWWNSLSEKRQQEEIEYYRRTGKWSDME